MSRDIVPELLEAIQNDFDNGLNKSPRLRKIQKQIEEGNVSFTEANSYAIEVGEILSNSLQDHIKADILPDGKMYYNIAKRIMESVLGKNYELISEIAVKVQGILNKKAKMRILPQKPKLNQDRINGFVEKLSSEEDFRKVQFMLGDQVVNFSQSVVDETIEKNAKFHLKSGFKPKIIRKPESRACKWCRGLSGTYEYPNNVPEDIYRRHQNCRCTVEYIPDKKRKQNVWSKKWTEPDKNAKIKRRIELNEREKSHKGINRSTQINRKKVFSNDYDRKFNKLNENKSVTRKIKRKSREVLGHRSGTEYEDLVYIDSKTGRSLSQKNFNKVRTVSPTKAMNDMISGAEPYTIIGLHNHANSSMPSPEDIAVAFERKYKYGLIFCHDGNVIKYNVNKDFNILKYRAYEIKYNKYASIGKMEEFLQKVKEDGVEIEIL